MKIIVTRRGWGVLAAAVTAMVLGAAVVAWTGWRRPVAAAVESVTLDRAEYQLGDTIRVSYLLKLPWRWRPPAEVRLELPEDLDQVGRIRHRLTGLGFGWRHCRVEISLQPYGFGPFQEIPWSLQLRGHQPPPPFGGTLPAIVVKPRLDEHADSVPVAAGALPESFLRKHRPTPAWVWWCAGCGFVALAALTAWIVWRWRHQELFVPAPPKPWEVAEGELAALDARLGSLEPDAFFLQLTDIVRRYLEAAYELPATESTTQEFLRSINRSDGPLSTAHRLVLADFLTAADMIKFARGEATQEQLGSALVKARQFVIESSTELIRQAEAARNPSPAMPKPAGEESDASRTPPA